MIVKVRTESDELLIMRSLQIRMKLTEKEKIHYLTLERGYEGELRFDKLTEHLQEERYVLNDLQLEINGSPFQIDSLIISQGIIHLLDIKNHYGDFFLKDDKLYSLMSDREYKNPLDQLKRSSTLFRQLLQSLKLNYLVEPFVIFNNPEFMLYQAPLNQPIIFPTQVDRFIRELNSTPSTLNDGHKKLAQQLISLHQTKNRFSAIPEYHYEQLEKGVYCRNCHSFHVAIKSNKFVCLKCGTMENIEAAILRNVKEFKLLFPDRQITTQNIYEWCKADLNERTIRRVLKRNFTVCGNTKDTFYK